jgi:hypothetical protein
MTCIVWDIVIGQADAACGCGKTAGKGGMMRARRSNDPNVREGEFMCGSCQNTASQASALAEAQAKVALAA